MGKPCAVVDCHSKYGEDIGFFHFPVKEEMRRKWFDILQNQLTPGATYEKINKQLICSKHFQAKDIRPQGYRKRLEIWALPIAVEKETPEKVKKDEPKKVSQPLKTSSSAAQFARTPALEIQRLRGQIKNLTNKYTKLRTEPCAKFIFRFRHKLREFMHPDDYILFESAIDNFTKKEKKRNSLSLDKKEKEKKEKNPD